MDYKILQILQATDWYAVYDGLEDHFDPVTCFALIEDEHGQSVVPMVAVDTYIDRADTASNFQAIVHRPDLKLQPSE